jgi:hypothetical protein
MTIALINHQQSASSPSIIAIALTVITTAMLDCDNYVRMLASV